MVNDLSPELLGYLKLCGLPQGKIERCTGSTRMYHDLALYGEVAEGCMEVLVANYQVDMAGFEFEKFFPPEFAGKNRITRTMLWFIPFASNVARRRDQYVPLTLEAIDRTLRTKRWNPAAPNG